MGRTVALRQCGEHEACQLQRVNDGPWEHTPARTPLANRLATKPEEIKELEARLAGEVGQVMALRTQMGERLHHLNNRLHYLEGVAGGLPSLQNLLSEADRLNEVLQGEQGELLKKSNRMVRDFDRLERLTIKLEGLAKEAAERSRKAEQDAAAAAEQAVHIEQRLPVLDSLRVNAEDLAGKLARLDEVIGVVREADARFRTEASALHAELNECLRLINKEREERVQGYEKIQRQFREVMKRG